MMRRSAGFDADEARRQPLKEWQNVPALELTANDYITCRVNSVDLKNRLGDIETNCRDRLHVWLLRIVGALTAPTSMALACRWRRRPQHQKQSRQHRTPTSAAIVHQRPARENAMRAVLRLAYSERDLFSDQSTSFVMMGSGVRKHRETLEIFALPLYRCGHDHDSFRHRFPAPVPPRTDQIRTADQPPTLSSSRTP